MKLFEKTLNSNSVFDGRILHITVDDVELEDIARFEKELLDHVHANYPEIKDQVMSGKKLSAEQLDKLRSVIVDFKKDFR